ncbi:LEA type 2 family protein [Chryseosolibacter indicus]|uniref:LEA type 2 family protein n=1 Tax=Chryseosolibacter indicus TaxID=2782351 RepID=A0ABS5VNR5_9BACT|nr:LEA type 2 family protein [Chryseosolibacter indicus]MBT1702776.1 LEA type 2 family protein [Chryseosolibacter indicus]
MRSRIWVVAIAMVFVAIALIWWRAAKINNKNNSMLQPELSVASVSINNIDDEKIDMNAKMNLKNPLPVELKSQKLNYRLLINGTKVLESSYNKPISVKSNDSSSIEMPMEILAKPLISILDQLKDQKIDSAVYTLQASMDIDVPIAGKRTFDFDETKKLPSFLLPKIKTEDLDIKKLKFKESSLKMDVVVENPNTYPLIMEDANYDVVVGKDLEMNGTIPGITNIPAKSSATVPVQLDIQTQKIAKLAWNTLFNKDDTPFAVNFSCKIVSKNEMFDDSKIAMKTTGTLKDLKEARENVKEATN